ncbi:hypothetical protein D3C83_303360 [compost metagenome]
MAGLGGPEQSLDLLQGEVGRDAHRLVDQQRAVDHFLILVESIRRERWSPRSTDSS